MAVNQDANNPFGIVYPWDRKVRGTDQDHSVCTMINWSVQRTLRDTLSRKTPSSVGGKRNTKTDVIALVIRLILAAIGRTQVTGRMSP